MVDFDSKVAASHSIIDEGLRLHKADKVYALFSGGHDSHTLTHVTSRHPAFAGVLHINTGTGIKETNQYVHEACEAQGWKLWEYKPPVVNYTMLVLRYGFLGPDMHSIAYRFLKERALMAFIKDRRAEDDKPQTVVLSTGVRVQESVRRMGTVDVMRKDGVKVWLSPIWDWSAGDCSDYMKANGLRRNRVKDLMHISGECLCGAFAGKYERHELALWFPEDEQRLTNLEQLLARAIELGLSDVAPEYRTWGHGAGVTKEQSDFLPLCYYCRDARGDVA